MKKESKGLIFIVDISGFTRFVSRTANEDGNLIIRQLFNSIINANELSFQISEIEGDAILFYQFGKPLSVSKILAQFRKMLHSFQTQIKRLRGAYPIVKDLSIKVIVHYGEMSVYQIGRFFKLFGRPLIDAHRLLKNSIGLDTYVLITNQYINELTSEYKLPQHCGFNACELYDVGNLCYTYFPFQQNGTTACDTTAGQTLPWCENSTFNSVPV
jgi:hypothetical protein